ncbi:MAG: hypothetical protein NXI10_07880 [bacterium]|nr:hypothetical protein [bacterium]
MKKLLILPVLSLILFSCGNTTEEDYKNMAQDSCDCVNKATAQLSPRMQDILNEFGGDQARMESMMAEYAMEDQAAAMEDAQKFQGAVINDFTTCLDGVQKKYSDKFTTDSDEEVQKKMLDILKDLDGCASSYGMVKMAIGM